jgi:SAM-dependent methyltransferase
MTSSPEERTRLALLLDLLDETSDILGHRVQEPVVPAWCRERGWDAFLRSLDDVEVGRGEALGLVKLLDERRDAPESLRALAERVEGLTRITDATPTEGTLRTMRRVSRRKRAQLESLSTLARKHLARPRRVVDVGAGLGHLTRVLAEDLGCPAVGLELEEDRVEKARALSKRDASFERWDARTRPLPIEDGDLVVGLHACGELGDLVTRGAAETGADLILVSCCLQKIRGEVRSPLSRLGKERGFVASRALLGLANVSIRPVGVETSMEAIMASRETRYALRLLLTGRGVACAPGEESHGINRRQMNRGLEAVAPAALARRGLGAPSAEELREVSVRARREFSVIRRLSLPRAMLARALEVAVVADRAALLEDAGHAAHIVTAFGDETSPRNLTIVARAGRARSVRASSGSAR